MKILRRYELRSVNKSGYSQHVSWHVTETAAFQAREWWTAQSTTAGTYYRVRKVEGDG